MCTMHIRKVINNAPDIFPMDQQARTDFASDWRTFWTAVRSHVSTKVKSSELRFYDVPANPGTPMGDPVHVEPIDLLGTATGSTLPPQCSISVTLKTSVRKRWGRFYLPGPTTTDMTTEGRLQGAVQNSLATAAAGLTFRGGTGAAVVVFSRVHWNHQDPTEIQVDDIYDIIRRRRYSKANYRAIVPASP